MFVTSGTDIFTAHVAKQAKVMFLQACVTSSPGGGKWATPKVTTPPPLDQITTPSSPEDQVPTPPHPPGSVHKTPPSPLDQVTTLYPPGPDHNTSLPPGEGHNTSLPPPPRDYAQVGGTYPTGMHSC